MARKVIIALDSPSAGAAFNFLHGFRGEEKPFVKVGMELFYSAGASVVRYLKEMGHPVFLDLKLHDIPNTVGRSMASLSRLGADMVNLHTAGGSKMMKAAIKGLTRPDGSRPLLIGVTQLTSTSPEMLRDELLINADMEETVLAYAENANKSGLDGVVCSPLEARSIKQRCGAAFLTVTPGVRFAESSSDDQVRVTTPTMARELGSDFIVVGRPITQASDPVAAYERCVAEFGE